MGKSKNGNFVPPKGRPSSNSKETTELLNAFKVTDINEEQQLAAKYVDDEDRPAAGISLKHINRNTDKVK